MMNIFQQLTAITDPEMLCNMELDALKAMPIHLHCKDLKGHYIGCNERVMRDVGYTSKTDMLGRTDFDFDCLGEHEANSFRAIDKFIIGTGRSDFFTQSVTLIDKKKYIAMNHKAPLYSNSKKIIGVVSYGIIVNQYQSPYSDPSYPLLNLLFVSNPAVFQSLTERQTDCLYHLVRGLSIKEIARKLELSPRTVEHYLDSVKNKLNCNSRSELIDKIMKMQFEIN